jgi:hypothetical protein
MGGTAGDLGDGLPARQDRGYRPRGKRFSLSLRQIDALGLIGRIATCGRGIPTRTLEMCDASGILGQKGVG